MISALSLDVNSHDPPSHFYEQYAMSKAPDISVVVPVFDEESSLKSLHSALTDVLSRCEIDYEIVFVNDGSQDGSGAIIDDLAAQDERVRFVHFRRNFGKAAALDAGFKMASGSRVITMDADLQDDPEEIPKLLARLDQGHDVVNGWKINRHDPLGKRLPSRVFNAVVGRLSGLKLHDVNSGMKAYRAEALESLNLYGELHRFVPVLLHWQGFRVTEIPVRHHPRKTGVSKYGVERLLRGFFDLLTVLLMTRYRSRPLHLFGSVGLLISSCGFFVLVYLSVLWFMGHTIGGRPLLLFGILMMVVGLQFVSTGLIAELLVGAEHQQSKSRYSILRQSSSITQDS